VASSCPFGVVDGVQEGAVDAHTPRRTAPFGKDGTFALDCAVPFGLNSRQMTAWMYEGNGMKLFRRFCESYNIVNFPDGQHGCANMGGWYRKEIKSSTT
jgi:TRAP-type mannitol/chloroaromatic compound transport system substrate-binding protein